MKSLKEAVVAFMKEEEGLTAVEYAVAGGVIVVGLVGGFTELGDAVFDRIGAITDSLTGAGAAP